MTIGTIGTVVLLAGFIIILIRYQKNQVKRREEVFRLQQERQSAILRASVESTQKERERIARSLHDQVGGTLSGVKMALSAGADEGASQEKVQLVNKELSEAIKTVRSISQDLLPPALEKYGLGEGLVSKLEKHADLFGWEVAHSLENISRIAPFIEKEAYEVVVELLNNLGKHGQATRVSLKGSMTNDQISISIEDNGVEFDPTGKHSGSDSLGLLNLNARLASIDGRLEYRRENQMNLTSLEIPNQTIES